MAIGLKKGRFLICKTKDLSVMQEIHHKARKQARQTPAAAPRASYYPFPVGKVHTMGNIWRFTAV